MSDPIVGQKIQAMSDELAEIKARLSTFEDRLSAVASVSVPVGTIAAFAGVIGKIPSTWKLCDGERLDVDRGFKRLFDAIGIFWGGSGPHDFKLPDLRGLFLRGVDGGTNRDTRRAHRVLSNSTLLETEIHNVGSLQGDATKMPNIPFAISAPDGVHSHPIDLELDASRDPDGDILNTAAYPYIGGPHVLRTGADSGAHSHSLTGGDSETEPKNAYVFWIIKVI
jgi:microcystin-dependent protein